MSFLAPFFLLGALAVGLPIIFHLIRRTTRERIPFSSLMFLAPTPPRVTRRSRLENILLLLLRCLVLGLLAFGFARPFLRQPVTASQTPGTQHQVAILIDTSASMWRGDLWAQAVSEAQRALERLQPSDVAGIFAFDKTVRAIMSFEDWNAQPAGSRIATAQQKIKALQPTWQGTDLGAALLHVIDIVEDASTRADAPQGASVELVTISDFASGSRLTGLQGHEWPKRYKVSLRPLRVARQANASLQPMVDATTGASENVGSEIRVRVSNAPDSPREQFQLSWARDTATFGTIDAYVPPGQSRVYKMPLPPETNRMEQLRLAGDDVEFDNKAYVVPLVPQQIRILYLGKESPGDARQPLYYLQRAFPQTRAQQSQVVAVPTGGEIPPEAAAKAALVVVADQLPANTVTVLQGLVRDGQTILVLLSSPGVATTLGALLGVPNLRAEEGTPRQYAMLGQIDFQHPLFASFADPRYSDFTKIHFWKYRRLVTTQITGARVVAQFDNGDPAILDVPLGKGNVMVLTSGWQPSDSQLALSSKFVPLLYSMIERGGRMTIPRLQHVVGDDLPLRMEQVSGALTLRKPDGSETVVTNGMLAEAELPGIYALSSGSVTQRFAVNLPPEESRTTPMDLEELSRLGVPVDLHSDATKRLLEKRQAHLRATELENRQRLWWWFVLAAVALLLCETWVAGLRAQST